MNALNDTNLPVVCNSSLDIQQQFSSASPATPQLSQTAHFFHALYSGATEGTIVFCRALAGGFTRIAVFDLAVAGQLDAAIAFSESDEAKDCYFKYNLFRGELILARGDHAIGAKREVWYVIGIALDIDTAEKNPKYLDRLTVLGILDNCGAFGLTPPTIIVGSDGPYKGLHVYWLFHQPILIRDYDHYCEFKTITKRWYKQLALLMHPCELDATSGPERLLRPVGSRRSSGNVVQIIGGSGQRYTLDQLTLPAAPNEQSDALDFDAVEDSVIGEYLDWCGWDVIDIMRQAEWWSQIGDPSYWHRKEASTNSPTAQVYTSGDGRVGVTIKTPGTIYTLTCDPFTGARLPATCPDAPTWMSREKFFTFMMQGGRTDRRAFIDAANLCRKLLPRGSEFEPIEPINAANYIPPPKLLSAKPKQIKRCVEEIEALDPSDNWLFAAACRCMEWGLDYEQGVAAITRAAKLPLTEAQVLETLEAAFKHATRGLRADGTYETRGDTDAKQLATAVLRKFGWLYDDPSRVGLRFYRGGWYTWTGTGYANADDQIESKIVQLVQAEFDELGRRAIDAAKAAGTDLKYTQPSMSPTTATKVLHSIKAMVLIEQDMPCRLSNITTYQGPMETMIPVANGLLETLSGALYPHDPRIFYGQAPAKLIYDPKAVWTNKQVYADYFADQGAFRRDIQMKAAILLRKHSLQKFFWLYGPPRSGKGTSNKVTAGLVGKHCMTGWTWDDMAERFGLSKFIGRSVAIMGEGGDRPQKGAATKLKSIIGGDNQSIELKGENKRIDTTLTPIFIISSNEFEKFTDSSGALINRMIPIAMGDSFAAKQKAGFYEQHFEPELSGILNCVLEEARQMVACDWEFAPSAASDDLLTEQAERASIFTIFIDDYLELDPTYVMDKGELRCWLGMFNVLHERKWQNVDQALGDLYAASKNEIRSKQLRVKADGDDESKRIRVVAGCRLKPEFIGKEPAISNGKLVGTPSLVVQR